jgi:hypothetical protein
MRQIKKGWLVIVGASALVACASHAPVADTTDPATGKAIPKGYRLVVKKGNEYYCRMQPVTGSHTLKTEVCLTQEQLEAEKHQGLAFGMGPTSPAQVGGMQGR